MGTNRRDFIRYVVMGSIAAGCPVELSLAAPADNKPVVDGEDNRICHQVRDGKVFTRPPVSAHHDVVIVGGGVSGLTAAYLLRHHDFLLLEKEPHLGGNAYLMDYNGTPYATGAAFIWSGDSAYPFAKEIGLEPLPINDWDGTIINGEFIPDTWGDGLDKLPYPAPVRESFKKFKKEMLAIKLERRARELFAVPFSDFMKGYADEVELWWDTYGPSNWGATSEETAAAVGIGELQGFAGDKREDVRYTWPGGNGAITKRLGEILQAKSADRLQTGATTVAVVSGKTDVQVTYMQGAELKTVVAKAVIMATPKFITRRIVEGLPDKQSEAMHQIRYIPYPVVNLIFDKSVYNKGYDTWCPGNRFTDFVVADWVVRNQPGYQQKYNILSYYTPMREDDRGYLLTELSTRKVAQNVLHDFQKLFPGSNVDPVEVHIYRRGHPLYMSTPKLFTEVQPLVREPLDRIFFANTDCEGPESTTSGAISAAQRAAREVEHRLAGKPAPKETAVVAG
ncbi:MAG: FAD-dependent oxidoreductase [Acidobacteriia bacterium]|nr:FAD-dependent oxidoreductase [Terriglobia bacterium]